MVVHFFANASRRGQSSTPAASDQALRPLWGCVRYAAPSGVSPYGDGVDQGVAGPAGLQELQRMCPGRNREGTGGEGGVTVIGWGEGSLHDAIDQHFDCRIAGSSGPLLRCVERYGVVGAGLPAGDPL